MAGLGAALGLAGKGLRVQILERRAALSDAGAGIQIGPNGVKALERLGALQAVEKVAFAPQGIAIYQGASGTKLTTLPLADNRYGAPYLSLLRADLQSALLATVAAVPAINLTLGFEVESFNDTEAGVRVRSTDGRSFEGAALIGADGLWSRVRREVAWEEVEPTGYVAYRTLIPRAGLASPFDAPEVGLWLGDDAHVVHYPVRRGELLNLVVVIEGRESHSDWDTPGSIANVLPKLARWPRALRDLLEAATVWRSWTLYDLKEPARWVNGRLALIGDAAHPVLPFLAQGAVMAFEDAVALAECVGAAGASIPEALAAYEHARSGRARQLAAAARENGRTYHMKGLAAVARDATLRLTPPGMLLGRYDWLYGFEPGSYVQRG